MLVWPRWVKKHGQIQLYSDVHIINIHRGPFRKFKVILLLVQSDTYLICEVRNMESTFTRNKLSKRKKILHDMGKPVTYPHPWFIWVTCGISLLSFWSNMAYYVILTMLSPWLTLLVLYTTCTNFFSCSLSTWQHTLTLIYKLPYLSKNMW